MAQTHFTHSCPEQQPIQPSIAVNLPKLRDIAAALNNYSDPVIATAAYCNQLQIINMNTAALNSLECQLEDVIQTPLSTVLPCWAGNEEMEPGVYCTIVNDICFKIVVLKLDLLKEAQFA